jgi:hypothetical protein
MRTLDDKRRREITAILDGHQPGVPWAYWVGLINAGLIIGLLGGLAWATWRWW